MGGCGSKPKPVDQYHVGLTPKAVENIPDESIRAAFRELQKDEGIEIIQKDDENMMTFLVKSESNGQTSRCLHCCCCCGIFSKALIVNHGDEDHRYGEDGCCAWLVPETCNCCSGLSYLTILRGHHDPRALSHRRFWSIDYSTAKGQVQDCCGISCPTCYGFCPIVGMTQGFCWSPCNAKKMRMIALGFSEEEIQCAGWICCSSTDWNTSQTKGKYMCCQEYEDKKFIKPALWCKICTDVCPETMLNVEVCTFPGLSMSSSQSYFLDTRDLKPDPKFEEENKHIHFVEQLEKILGHVERHMPVSEPHMHFSRRLLHSYTSCLQKAHSSPLIYQMKTHAQQSKDEFWPKMQGRHKENTVFKMAHRLVQRKSYVIKVTKNFFEGGKGMRDKKLVVDYKLPRQLIMGDNVNEKDDADRWVNKKGVNEKDDADSEENKDGDADPEENKDDDADPDENKDDDADPEKNKDDDADPEENKDDDADPEENKDGDADPDENKDDDADLEKNGLSTPTTMTATKLEVSSTVRENDDDSDPEENKEGNEEEASDEGM